MTEGSPRVSPSSAAEIDRRLGELVEARPPLLVVTDFDGTLAPITTAPLEARIVPLARSALRRLAAHAETRPDRLRLAVLSGRTALDVAGRVRVGGIGYLGNHGLEVGRLARRARAGSMRVAVDPALLEAVPAAHALGEGVAERMGRPDWLFVEEKGPSVAFHFRQAPDPEAARTALLTAIEATEKATGGHGLAAFEGRKVIEFRPLGAGGKGAAIERLIERERARAVLVLGDDVSDAEAFRAVRDARAEGHIAGLTVGVHGAAETPPAVLEAADVILPAPADAARLLARLDRLLAEPASTDAGQARA
ncbi:MAG: trehalose-phosphatase [Chloroflexota bacterium]